MNNLLQFVQTMYMEAKVMKKIFVLLLCFTLLTGCGRDTTDQNQSNNSSNNNVTDKNTDNQGDDWYTRFESGLKGKNVNYSSKSVLDAASIGGVEGYRYVTENGNIDVYRYEDGDDFNKIVKNKKLNIDGSEKNIEVNDHYVIVSDGLSDDVMSIFRGLK